MDKREIKRWELPGYAAYAVDKAVNAPFPRAWAAFWFLWGLTVAGLIVWRDGNFAAGGCFVAWGALIGFCGWRALAVAMDVVSDWAQSHFTESKDELAAIRETLEAFDLARGQGQLDEEHVEIPDSPVQRRWMQQELFTMLFAIPWFMGLIHGVGIGGLAGAVLALIPGLDSSVTSAATTGAIGGAITVASIVAVVLSLFPFATDISPVRFSLRQRMLLAISPLLAVPALVEAAVLWWRWYANWRSEATSIDG